MAKADRRVQRTRELLQSALIELIGERDYDAITIQDIVDHANVGRTTFYLHYNSKDELFLSCHEAIVSAFQIGSRHPLSRQEWMAAAAPSGMKAAYEHLMDRRTLLSSIFQGRDRMLMLRQIRDRNALDIQANLHAVFEESESAIPFDLLANYLAGAQIALLQWWLEKRRVHTPENLAQAFHRLQRAAIRDALGVPEET